MHDGMSVLLYFNERSLDDPADTVHQAREWVGGVVDVLLALASRGVRGPIRGSMTLFERPIAPDYLFPQWLNDHDVARERRQLLQSRLSQAPLIAAEAVPDDDEGVFIEECQFEGRPVVGCQAAYQSDGLAVSLLSHGRWNEASICLRVTRVTEDDEAEFDRDVRHAATVAHVAEHENWLTAEHRNVRDAIDFWQRRQELCPNLEFCERVRDQIVGVSPGNPEWHAILTRLWELEDYFAAWREGQFQADRIPSRATPESEATLNQYAQSRTFLCPDGVERVFEWHLHFTPNARRIHFIPDAERRIGLIGYIGPHLPTARYH